MNKNEIRLCVGEKIKQLREERKITQKELAKKINVRGTSISNYESGYRSPSLFALYNLAQYFDVPISVFFQEQNKGERYENNK